MVLLEPRRPYAYEVPYFVGAPMLQQQAPPVLQHPHHPARYAMPPPLPPHEMYVHGSGGYHAAAGLPPPIALMPFPHGGGDPTKRVRRARRRRIRGSGGSDFPGPRSPAYGENVAAAAAYAAWTPGAGYLWTLAAVGVLLAAHVDIQPMLIDEFANVLYTLALLVVMAGLKHPVSFACTLAVLAGALAFFCRKPARSARRAAAGAARLVLRGDGLRGDGGDGGDGLSDDDAAAPSDDEDLDDLVAVLTDTWDFRAAPDNDNDDDDDGGA